MNHLRYTEGDPVTKRRYRFLSVSRVVQVVVLVISGSVTSLGHAQTQELRTLEQQVIPLEEFVAGADPELARQATVEAGDSENPGAPAESGSNNLTRDRFMAMIANEVVLAPGIGLQHIRLGEPLDSVKERLGPPRSVSRTGFLPRYYVLTYLLDGGTTVQLVGRKVVERIQITGNSAALIRTAQGARFGMDPVLIQRIYRAPTSQRQNRLEYRNHGITFYFGEKGGGQSLSDGVSRMEIYRPGARGSS